MEAPIISAAVLYNGIIHFMPRPNRHHNIVHAMNHEKRPILIALGNQGFLDANGNFLEREEAAIRAEKCNQLKKELIAPPKLYSEDLW